MLLARTALPGWISARRKRRKRKESPRVTGRLKKRISDMSVRIVFCCLIISALFACDTDRVYEKNEEIDDHEWRADESKVFQVVLEDTAQRYNVYVNVRNAGYYRYSNLFLFINTYLPTGEMQRDTLECKLASPEGKWLGDGLGDIWDNRILFKTDVRFPLKGEYKFEIMQAMREDPLHGIMDAGIRIERAG
jgi:gliding motility-associated lipoprotein GldH